MTTEEIAVNLAKHERDIKSLEHRMSDVEKSQTTIVDLTSSVRELTINLQYMVEEQKKQGERLSKLETEPIEQSKWIRRTIISSIITGAVSIIAGILIGILMRGG